VSTEADVAAINALLFNNQSMISSGDLEGWINQFTEDAVFMQPDEEAVNGKEAGRQAVRPWYENFDMGISVSVDEIEVLGDTAFARWSCAFQATPKSGGVTTERNAKEIWILRRQPDDSWKCSHIIYNYDSPAPLE
jgi:uncharacterized protein (TIGR02246 family)